MIDDNVAILQNENGFGQRLDTARQFPRHGHQVSPLAFLDRTHEMVDANHLGCQ